MSNIAGADERRLIRDIMKGNRMAMQELYNLTVRNMKLTPTMLRMFFKKAI